MRRVKLIIGAVLLLGVPVTLAAAQLSVPTVGVSASGSNVVLDPSGPIGAGPTRFTFEGRGEFNLATLRAGVSVDQLRQSLSDPSSVKALGQVFLEASAAPGKAVTVDLRPNTTYVAAVIAGRRNAFTTSPQVPPTERPRRGRTRVSEWSTTGSAVQRPCREAVASGSRTPGRPSTSRSRSRSVEACRNRQVNRALRGTNERALGRVVAGEPVDIQGLISQGSTNDNEVSFSRPGRYAMVCFFSEHNRLGMYRVVRVR